MIMMRIPWFCMSLVLLLAPLPAAEHFWDEIPACPSTTRPSQVLDDYWNSQFTRVSAEVAAAKDCQLVFFGDSITWHWTLGKAVGKEPWQERFAAYHPINMGNSGDITPVMLHRATRGNLDFPPGQQPRVAVLLCGINNLIVSKSAGGKEAWELGTHCPPAEIAHGQRAIAQVFRRRLPATRLIMMGMLPVADPEQWKKCQDVNALQAEVQRNPQEVVFLNLQDHFLLENGKIDASLFSDKVHPNAAGYRKWADAIAPRIRELMQAPPLQPKKIMLIGGALTEGADSSSTYRRYLDGMLRRKGHLIDFVGTLRKHDGDKKEADSYEFDPDHEAHAGKDSAWLAQQMPRLLEKHVPDIAVLEMGAEDWLAQGQSSELLTRSIAGNILRVCATLRAKNPRVKIVLLTHSPAEEYRAAAASLNKTMQGFQALPEFGKITIVDASQEPAAGSASRQATQIAAKLADVLSALLADQ